MFLKIFTILFLTTAVHLSAATNLTSKYFVNTETLKVRVAPNAESLHSYSIYKNYTVSVHEIKNGWARISRYKTIKVNATLKKEAKWVSAEFITPIKRNTSLIKVLTYSDNYQIHENIFHDASQQLINNKTCTINDFKIMRGWVESPSNNIYFTYCGGFKKYDKVYLDVETGAIS